MNSELKNRLIEDIERNYTDCDLVLLLQSFAAVNAKDEKTEPAELEAFLKFNKLLADAVLEHAYIVYDEIAHKQAKK